MNVLSIPTTELISLKSTYGSYLSLLNLKVTAYNNVQSLYEDLLMITVGFDQLNSSVIYRYFGAS